MAVTVGGSNPTPTQTQAFRDAFGLGSVDNTADANKPISSATQTALDGKADEVHAHQISDVTGLDTALSGKSDTAHTHSAATTGAAGFMSATDKTKLDGIAASANNYTHPTTDGSLHVPATGTTSSGNVLTAGATAGSLSWAAPLALGATAGTALGTAAVGTATTAARSDHVHPIPVTAVEQSDIGTAPNEIPLNQHLGGMAFQSPEAVVIKPAASATPQQVGSMVFQLTNDTTLVVKVKGSDGTVRSATLTLA